MPFRKTCSASVRGASHAGNGLPCQDARAVFEGDGFAVAVVADGVGSAAESETGARIAAETVARLLGASVSRHTGDEALCMAKGAFGAALSAVRAASAAGTGKLRDYDTTLCAAIAFDGGRVVWGNAGDSGIIALSRDGRYLRLTRQQRDPDGRVWCLRPGAPSRWRFGAAEGIAAIALMTDGLWDGLFCHPLLDYGDSEVDVSVASAFLDPPAGAAPGEMQRDTVAFLEACPAGRVDDDKTIVVLRDDEAAVPRLGPDAYEPVDYGSLLKAAESEPYPPREAARGGGAALPDQRAGREGATGAEDPAPLPGTGRPAAIAPAGKPGRTSPPGTGRHGKKRPRRRDRGRKGRKGAHHGGDEGVHAG